MPPTPRFLKSLNYVLVNEGVAYVKDPRDPGGATKYGITLKSLTGFWAKQGKSRAPTDADVAALVLDQAQEFYDKEIWAKMQGDAWTSPGAATALFDCVTLMGAKRAVSSMQANVSTLNQISLVDDGVFGPKTLAAVNTVPQKKMVSVLSYVMGTHCVNLCDERPELRVFLNTWTRRAGRLLTLSFDS